MNPRFLIVLSALLLMLGACGQKGDLHPPQAGWTSQADSRQPATQPRH